LKTGPVEVLDKVRKDNDRSTEGNRFVKEKDPNPWPIRRQFHSL